MSIVAALICAISGVAAGSLASAQAVDSTPQTYSATPRGTIGVGVIGAEVGMMTASLSRLDRGWALGTFAAVGAAAGAVLGYKVVDQPGHQRLGSVLDTVAFALAIPTVIISVQSIRRGRDERALQPKKLASRAPQVGTLIAHTAEGFSVGIPVVAVQARDHHRLVFVPIARAEF